METLSGPSKICLRQFCGSQLQSKRKATVAVIQLKQVFSNGSIKYWNSTQEKFWASWEELPIENLDCRNVSMAAVDAGQFFLMPVYFVSFWTFAFIPIGKLMEKSRVRVRILLKNKWQSLLLIMKRIKLILSGTPEPKFNRYDVWQK